VIVQGCHGETPADAYVAIPKIGKLARGAIAISILQSHLPQIRVRPILTTLEGSTGIHHHGIIFVLVVSVVLGAEHLDLVGIFALLPKGAYLLGRFDGHIVLEGGGDKGQQVGHGTIKLQPERAWNVDGNK